MLIVLLNPYLGKGAKYGRCYTSLIGSDILNRAIFDDFEWSSKLATYRKLFQMRFFEHLCSIWQDVNWHD